MMVAKQFVKTIGMVALLISTSAYAQEFDVSAKPIGDITRWTADNGDTSVEYKGKQGDHYELAFERDASKGEPPSAKILSTRDGQAVKFISSGVTTTFNPHDCTLTLGRCVYTQATSSNRSRKMISNASVKEDVWTYTLHHTEELDRNLIEKGSFTIDDFGFVIDRIYTSYNKGKPTEQWTKRVR